MLNVANLEPEFFRAILAGSKSVEYRHRRARDSRLDAVARGEPVVFLECRSDRGLLTHVQSCKVVALSDGRLEYRIRLTRNRHSFRMQVRKLQGWSRRTALV